VIEESAWREGWKARLRERFAALSAYQPWVDGEVGRHVERWDRAEERAVLEVDGGWVALRATDTPMWQIVDVFIEPHLRGTGKGRAALDAAIDWAARKTGTLMAITPDGDPAVDALLRQWPVRALNMLKPVSSAGLPADPSRPMRQEEFEHWERTVIADYAEAMADSGALPPKQARERAVSQHNEILPDGHATAGHTFTCIEVDGEMAAMLWLGHGFGPGTSWVYKVEVAQAHRGEGLGRAMMLAGEWTTLAAGNPQLGLNVFGHNDIAIGLYRSLGYRTTDVLRSVDLT
jgi:GNAT superfamily N-acetyltransferase